MTSTETEPANAEPVVRIGRYEIIERIAVGGMAEAFRARARGPGGYQRELVIKRILPHLVEDPEFVRAFVDEAKILGMLNHPNVVGVYDFGEDQGRHYLALEFLNGPSLAAIIERASRLEEPIPVGMVAYFGREICHGLTAVHTLRDPLGRPFDVIHRDVTPSNVMTTLAGGVKLLDFGVAKIVNTGKVTRHGQLKGKSGYFAPEQIAGGPIDVRVDLFALGVLLHEMLCLQYLFFGEGGDLATIYRIMEMPIPTPSSSRADVPPALDAIVMKALARDRDQRYQTAEELAQALDEVVTTEGVRAPDVQAFIQRFVAGS
jgi:serine/threonine protein kinase